jgi:hypothetical protein
MRRQEMKLYEDLTKGRNLLGITSKVVYKRENTGNNFLGLAILKARRLAISYFSQKFSSS